MAPEFFIVGAPKAGTTALHRALAGHPQLAMSSVKEPKFFLCDGQPPPPGRGPGDAHSAREWVWDRSAYEALFAGSDHRLRGESTPFYLYDRAAHRRIAEAVPEAKLIVLVRDPVDRAYSNWLHLWSDGLEPVSDFFAACALETERIAAGWAPFWHYLGLGRYGEQLEDLFTVFPRSQVLVLRYRQLVDSPAQTLDRICSFLGVVTGSLDSVPGDNWRGFVPATTRRRALSMLMRAGAAAGAHVPPQVWRKASVPLLWALHHGSGPRPALPVEQRRQLLASFTADIAKLEQVTGESFSDWLADRGRGEYSARVRQHD